MLREACGEAGVRHLVISGLQDLEEAHRSLVASIDPPSVEAYRQFLHHLDNAAAELDLDDVRLEIAAERRRVLQGQGSPDARLLPSILAATETLRRYLS
jgi:hypothetical protein